MIRHRFGRGATPLFLAFALGLAWTPDAAAQDRLRKNSMFLEVGGASWQGATLNYERVLIPRLRLRAGAGGTIDDPSDTEILFMPSFVLLGKGRHQLTAGIGALGVFFDSGCRDCSADWALTSEIGYRYTAKFGLMGRATLGLVAFNVETGDKTPFHLGLSLGWSF